MVLFNH